MAISGARLAGGLSFAQRGSTIAAWVSATSGSGIALGALNGSEWYIYFDGTGISIGGTGGFVSVVPRIAYGQKYFVCLVIDSGGTATFYFGSPRGGGGVATKLAVDVSGTTLPRTTITLSVPSYTSTVSLLANSAGSFPLTGTVERLAIWTSALNASQVNAAAQISSAPWTGGSPTVSPTGCAAYYPLASTADLTDHSGNGAAAITQTGSNTSPTGVQQPAVPGTIGAEKIVCAGDSITHGYVNYAPHDYPTQLASLRGTSTVTNIGHDGDMWRDTQDLIFGQAVDRAKDNIVIINSGVNNFLNAGETSSQALAWAADSINTAQALGWNVIAMSLLPSSSSNAAYLAGNAAYNASIASQGADWFIDVGADSHFTPAGNAANPTYFYDTVHPSNAGYVVMGNVIQGSGSTGVVGYLASFTPTGGPPPLTAMQCLQLGYLPHLRM